MSISYGHSIQQSQLYHFYFNSSVLICMNWIKNHKYLTFVTLLFIIFFFPLPMYGVYLFFFPIEAPAGDWNGLFLFLWAFLGIAIFIPICLIWGYQIFYRLIFPKKPPTRKDEVAFNSPD